MPAAPLPNLPLWDRFLDAHPITVEEEEAFLDFLTRPGVTVPETLETLEAAYALFRAQEDDEA